MRPPQARTSRRRVRGAPLAMVAVAAIAASLLAGCGGGSGGSGPVTLTFYNQPDSSGAVQQNADNCSKASGGKYTIKYNKLPSAADQQRVQLVRRMAARDSSVDLMGLDVTWEAEFAEAGWAVPWTGSAAAQVKGDTVAGSLDTAMWKGKLVAVPYNSNTQLLWYRKDLVKTPPKTWDEMISMAQQLAKQGKPHYIEEQGAQYEGATVWFNSMVASAGGSILNANSTKVSLGAPALTALQTMKKMATSVAADPSLDVDMEDQGRQAMESGTAAFEINYPFVWPSMQANKPSFYKSFAYAPFPTVVAGKPAHSTIGGIDIAVSPYSKHRDLDFQAALCLRNKANQEIGAVVGGLPPTLTSLYKNPSKDFVKAYPFYKLIYQQLQSGAVRPKTPAYQAVSIAISHAVAPPSKIDPPKTLNTLSSQINDALNSKGLVP